MGFDDLFEYKHTHHGNYREYKYHDENRHMTDSYQSDHGYGDHTKWLRIIKKIWNNKKLKVLVIVAGTVFLVVVIVLIIVLVPLIIKLFNYISQIGLQGLLNGVIDFLDKIWKGSAE